MVRKSHIFLTHKRKSPDSASHIYTGEDVNDEEYAFNAKARSTIPSEYRVESWSLYWKSLKIDLPGEVWETFFYREVFVVVCKPRCALANVIGFNLHGNKIWTIDPAPHPIGTPAYHFVKWSERWNTLIVLEGRG